MEYLKRDKDWVLRLERGEKVLEGIKQLVNKESIGGGFFFGLGAVGEAELAHYSVENKKYSKAKFVEPLELVSITGSIAYYKGEMVVHAHGSFSRPSMEVIGGHLVEAVVSGTVEIMVITSGKLEKKDDKETGLKVLSLR